MIQLLNFMLKYILVVHNNKSVVFHRQVMRVTYQSASPRLRSTIHSL